LLEIALGCQQAMKFSVLINNYNYGRFLDRALASVAAQTRPADEIIVVDDGSTDDSLKVARRWAERDARVTIIAKENGGQLSAFNAGFQAATGDILTFLDADDEYLPGWLARLEEIYTRRLDIDFAFCKCELHGHAGPAPDWRLPAGDFDYGLTFFRSLLARHWVGTPTSALSARRTLLARFLPCPLETAWRVQADAVLCYGASLALGRKFQIGDVLIRYHIHGDNRWYDQTTDQASQLAVLIRIRQLVNHLADFRPEDAEPRLILHEFRSIPNPRWEDARLYARMIRKFGGARAWLRRWHPWALWLRRRFTSSAQP
jgi:glycosyltransferase involved in cell wall biosynthesis